VSRILPLDDVRADGWFSRLGDDAPHFHELCDAIGERVVAFAIVAGVRITAVALDPRMRDASLITFTLGDDEVEHQLPLGELRRRLAATLVADEPYPDALSDEPSVEELQRFIGYRYLLLAPIFDVELRELRFEEGEPPAVLAVIDAEERLLPLTELREHIRHRIREQGAAARAGSPFAIDLSVVPKAEAAAREGDWEHLVELLGTWPGPLSLLLRTREGAELAPDVRRTLTEALGLLGTAYVELGNFDWAEEVLRLAIQWGQELGGEVVGGLFLRLGRAAVLRGRHAQAIGLLRRALSLGADRAQTLGLLAQAFSGAGHHLPAVLCAREATDLGVDDPQLRQARERSEQALGPPWEAFREAVLA